MGAVLATEEGAEDVGAVVVGDGDEHIGIGHPFVKEGADIGPLGMDDHGSVQLCGDLLAAGQIVFNQTHIEAALLELPRQAQADAAAAKNEGPSAAFGLFLDLV